MFYSGQELVHFNGGKELNTWTKFRLEDFSKEFNCDSVEPLTQVKTSHLGSQTSS